MSYLPMGASQNQIDALIQDAEPECCCDTNPAKCDIHEALNSGASRSYGLRISPVSGQARTLDPSPLGARLESSPRETAEDQFTGHEPMRQILPRWQDITPSREPEPMEQECTTDPCTNPEHDHEEPTPERIAQDERHLALLKIAAPAMCGITDEDLDRIAEVLRG